LGTFKHLKNRQFWWLEMAWEALATATMAMFQQSWLQRYFFSMFESNFCPPVWIRIAYPDQDADPWSGKLTYHLPYNIDIERTSI
jgi:hypothetical protein